MPVYLPFENSRRMIITVQRITKTRQLAGGKEVIKMSRSRINPDSGIIEHQDGWLDRQLGTWHETKNEDGNSERVNVDTGEVEESGGLNRWLGIWT